MRRFLITALLSVLLSNLSLIPSGAQDSSTPQGSSSNSAPAPAFKLFAGVTHQQMLPWANEALQPHVDKQLKAGAATSVTKPPPPPTPPVAPRQPTLTAETAAKQSNIPTYGVAHLTAERTPDPPRPIQHYTVEWFMIPVWMAGAWVKDGDMTTSVTDLRTGMSRTQNAWTENRLEAIWGHQQDAQGNYWHVNLLPSERDGASSGKLVRFLTVAQQCLNSTPQQLMTRTHYIVSESNPWSHQTFDTFQQESLNHYAMGAQNQLMNTSSNRVFSYEGVPIREGTLMSQFAKIGQFTPVATLNGVDLRKSLNDYLQSHALGHLKK